MIRKWSRSAIVGVMAVLISLPMACTSSFQIPKWAMDGDTPGEWSRRMSGRVVFKGESVYLRMENPFDHSIFIPQVFESKNVSLYCGEYQHLRHCDGFGVTEYCFIELKPGEKYDYDFTSDYRSVATKCKPKSLSLNIWAPLRDKDDGQVIIDKEFYIYSISGSCDILENPIFDKVE